MEYYLVIKRNEILTHDIAWMNLATSLHYVKEASSQKTMYYEIPVKRKSRIVNSIETVSR